MSFRVSVVGNATHIVGYCRQQQGINIRDVIASINIMLDSTPAKYFAACPQQTLEKAKKEEILREKRGTRLAVDNDMDDHIAGLESMALHAGHAIFPLPTGDVPAEI